jgi:hypothetical protein
MFAAGLASLKEVAMGLLDVLNGMQHGPRGPSGPSTQSGGGMSPMTMAILGLLAFKAIKHLTAGQPGAAPAPANPANAGAGGGGMGDLGGLLKGGLGRQRPEQGDRTGRSCQCAGRRPDQFAGVAKRDVIRRIAQRSEPVSARGRQPSNAGRAAADRGRSVGPALRPVALHRQQLSRFFSTRGGAS